MQVECDWTLMATPEELERQMTAFVFKGPGLYCTDTDTVLITPIPPDSDTTLETIWNVKQSERTLYLAHVYNCPFKETIFAAVGSMPTRSDSRASARTPCEKKYVPFLPGTKVKINQAFGVFSRGIVKGYSILDQYYRIEITGGLTSFSEPEKVGRLAVINPANVSLDDWSEEQWTKMIISSQKCRTEAIASGKKDRKTSTKSK